MEFGLLSDMELPALRGAGCRHRTFGFQTKKKGLPLLLIKSSLPNLRVICGSDEIDGIVERIAAERIRSNWRSLAAGTITWQGAGAIFFPDISQVELDGQYLWFHPKVRPSTVSGFLGYTCQRRHWESCNHLAQVLKAWSETAASSPFWPPAIPRRSRLLWWSMDWSISTSGREGAFFLMFSANNARICCWRRTTCVFLMEHLGYLS